VFVQADCRDEQALDEVRWVARLAVEYPVVCGIVAYAPLHLGHAVEPHLLALLEEPLVVGVRWLLQGHPPELLARRGLVEGVRLLATSGLTFDLCVTHDQLPAVAKLVEACPDTSFVLDHLGKPPIATGRLEPWRSDLARVASFTNVACKLSGLSTEAPHGWRELEVLPYLNHALKTFGPQRCMIGSDWPVSSLRITMERWFDIVLAVVAELSTAEQDAVLRRTAMATYDLSLPAGASAR